MQQEVVAPITLLRSANETLHFSLFCQACLPPSEESQKQKWVMLGISAVIFVRRIKPPDLQGQFIPIMSEVERFLCSLIIASRPQFLGEYAGLRRCCPLHPSILLSQQVRMRASENFSQHFIPCYWTRTIFKIVVQKIHTGPNLLLCGTVAAQPLLY